MKCPICQNDGKVIFQSKVLKKYDVNYFQCPGCAFVYTESPFWLQEAYDEALVDSDVGVMTRNIDAVIRVKAVIDFFYKKDNTFLDYGGGYGIFTRMMRDAGYNFLWFDKFAKPLLARGFEYNDGGKIDLLTSFEVLEHLVNPVEEIKRYLDVTHELIFTTVCYDKKFKWKEPTWWYYGREHGQHIAFYSEVTLQYLAESFGLRYYKLMGLHWFTKKKVSKMRLLWMNVMYHLGVYRYRWINNLSNKQVERDYELLKNSNKIN
ncbi:MAG: class I SAM-dependent methyltransferase [Lachnospiraceae bacterium]